MNTLHPAMIREGILCTSRRVDAAPDATNGDLFATIPVSRARYSLGSGFRDI